MRKATAAKPAPAPEADEAPELVVDREFKSPQPLDRNVCTVSLKTPTNDVTEGYDLHMSANLRKRARKARLRRFRHRGRLLDEQGQHRALIPSLRPRRDK